uniref:Two-component response regulator-like APRR2 isoform X2 n=1 Tax=Rhizophora mucronata TaxID=61149 RepID=A0A2P2M043_RHIMU
MVCTANDLLAWKDFPKGLRVLLLDEDTSSAAEMKSKLEAMDYFGQRFLIPHFCSWLFFLKIIFLELETLGFTV